MGTLQLGKGRTLSATGVASRNSSRLFHVRDANTYTHFLVDTGSEVSVLPPSTTDRRQPPDNLAVSHTAIGM